MLCLPWRQELISHPALRHVVWSRLWWSSLSTVYIVLFSVDDDLENKTTMALIDMAEHRHILDRLQSIFVPNIEGIVKGYITGIFTYLFHWSSQMHWHGRHMIFEEWADIFEATSRIYSLVGNPYLLLRRREQTLTSCTTVHFSSFQHCSCFCDTQWTRKPNICKHVFVMDAHFILWKTLLASSCLFGG